MTLIIPNAQEVIVLTEWINKNDPWTLRLFSNNVTPAVGSVVGDFTEVSGGGYVAKSLLAASWGYTAAVPTIAVYAVQVFVFSGTTTAPGTIYGYYITDSNGDLVCAERLAAPPYTPATAGDAAAVIPQVAAQQI